VPPSSACGTEQVCLDQLAPSTTALPHTVFRWELAAGVRRVAVMWNSNSWQKARLLHPYWVSSSSQNSEMICRSIHLSKNHSVPQTGIKNIGKEFQERINTVY